MNTIKDYSGYLTFPGLSEDQIGEIRATFSAEGLEIDLTPTALEFEFQGRDLGDRIVHCLANLASVVGDAEREVRCEMDDDEREDPSFVFYSIRNGRLLRQTGLIVRSEELREVEPGSEEDKPGLL